MRRGHLLWGAILLGCGGSARPALDASPTERCSGATYVAVTNDWTRVIEVYAETRSGSVTGTLLGSVQPGSSTEFPLPPGAIRARLALEGITDPVALPSAARRYVLMRYLCK